MSRFEITSKHQRRRRAITMKQAGTLLVRDPTTQVEIVNPYGF